MLAVVTVVGAPAVGGALAQNRTATTLNPKQIADYVLAETGAPLLPAWSAADETISLRAQSASARVITSSVGRDREGAMALRRACGLLADTHDAAAKRALNRAVYASELRLDLKPNLNAPDDIAMQRTNLVGLNRLDAYASGYEIGSYESIDFIFRLEPNIKTKICKIVASSPQ